MFASYAKSTYLSFPLTVFSHFGTHLP